MNKRTILVIELAVVGLALLLWWWSTAKPDSQAMSEADFTNAGPYQVAVSVTPSKPVMGANQLQILVRDNNGQPLSGAKVRAVGEMPAMGTMSAMYAPAEITEVAPGRYEGSFELTMAGEWPLAVDIAEGENHVDLTFDMATGREGLRLATATPAGEVAYHTCSMHPSVKSATPGTCPICGMDLVPVTHEEINSGSIRVEEGRRQTIGVRTGKVKRETVSLSLRLQGQLAYDASRLTDISLRFDGWIGELKVTDEGQAISQGETLFTVYSPELLTLQEDYLRARRSGNARLRSAARQRLMRAGITDPQLQWLAKRGKAQDYFPIFAPASGVVIGKHLLPGTAVKSGETLLRLADLSRLWVEAFAYEQDLPLLETGLTADLRIAGQPAIPATVAHVDPFLQRDTRTARVRLSLDNEAGRYQPGQFAQVNLQVPLGEQLLVPEDAVLVSGHKRIVFKDLGGGRLMPVPVRTGYRIDGQIVIRDGLEEGGAIVTAGTFLIASESKLKTGVDQW